MWLYGFLEVLEHHRKMYEKALAAQAKKYARRTAEHAVTEGAEHYGATGTLNKIKVSDGWDIVLVVRVGNHY